MQEKLDFYSNGEVPRTLLIILEDDLVDTCKPGDDITIKFDISHYIMLIYYK